MLVTRDGYQAFEEEADVLMTAVKNIPLVNVPHLPRPSPPTGMERGLLQGSGCLSPTHCLWERRKRCLCRLQAASCPSPGTLCAVETCGM